MEKRKLTVYAGSGNKYAYVLQIIRLSFKENGLKLLAFLLEIR